MLKFVVSVVIAGFLFVPGPRLAAGARAFASRLIAPRGAHFVDLAGATIRNVSRGVIGVALLQALLAGIVLYVAGIPGAGLIAFVVLLLCIVQIGPAPILLPLLIWIWMTHATTFALVLTMLLVPIALIDNVLKPILMARGLTTPMLVILTGVIGGTLTHGLVGLFLGPVVLSVFYELVVAWTRLGDAAAARGGRRLPMPSDAPSTRPVFASFAGYRPGWIKGDVAAGLAVAAVGLPSRDRLSGDRRPAARDRPLRLDRAARRLRRLRPVAPADRRARRRDDHRDGGGPRHHARTSPPPTAPASRRCSR